MFDMDDRNVRDSSKYERRSLNADGERRNLFASSGHGTPFLIRYLFTKLLERSTISPNLSLCLKRLTKIPLSSHWFCLAKQ
jgi:hypothetical protein